MKTGITQNCNGFSLVEIIMVLVLLGAVGVVASMGMTSFIQSFTISRQGTDTATTGQMAIMRMSKEFVSIIDVNATVSDNDTLRFTSIHDDGNHTFTLSQNAANQLILTDHDLGTADILANGLEPAGFFLTYYEWDYGNATQPIQERTTAPLWQEEEPCCLQVEITRAECDESNLAVQIIDDNVSKVYMVDYAGVSYYACFHDGGHFDLSEDANATNRTDCEPPSPTPELNRRVTGADYYDTAYLYLTGTPECYLEVPITNDDDDPCTIGAGSNPPPDATGADGGTRMIEATLNLSGIQQPFSVRVAPRNIYQCD